MTHRSLHTDTNIKKKLKEKEIPMKLEANVTTVCLRKNKENTFF